jgi:hypothetical protein
VKKCWTPWVLGGDAISKTNSFVSTDVGHRLFKSLLSFPFVCVREREIGGGGVCVCRKMWRTEGFTYSNMLILPPPESRGEMNRQTSFCIAGTTINRSLKKLQDTKARLAIEQRERTDEKIAQLLRHEDRANKYVYNDNQTEGKDVDLAWCRNGGHRH